MTVLNDLGCRYDPGMRLSPDAIVTALTTLPGWAASGTALVREFQCPSFPAALAFVNRLAAYAEAVDHHPDLHIAYRTVTVTWSTHSDGGITEKDIDGARATDRAAAVSGLMLPENS
jgi:4a-hydroxytetrahydrobiopterin dehydratase